MTTVRVTEAGVQLSSEMLEQFGMRAGDDLQVITTPDGINLKKVLAPPGDQLEVAKQVMDRRYEVLRRLAE